MSAVASEPMADAVTGTNTEKIDVLVQQVAALRADLNDVRATVRLILWLFGLAVVVLVPPTLTDIVYLATQVANTSADLKAVNARLDRMETTSSDDLRDQRERIVKLEAARKP